MERGIIEQLQDAEMLLIGIGEEFEERAFLRENPEYRRGEAYLEEIDRPDLLPLLADEILKTEGRIVTALQRLCRIITDKNYFIVSTCQTDILNYAGFPEERVVTPCGTLKKKQCVCGCEQSLAEVSSSERTALYHEITTESGETGTLGSCPQCHGKMVLNNVYVNKYLENGYLTDWSRYTKWLQGTLNRELCILELGVNLDYPSVIRFPFEKVGYYNQKASFIRVNERLYQLTSELREKGISVAKNSIDWLCM
ncbi:MAG: hypothetical protein K2O34_15530 [Acetatifactor sp.]|nr:hypothetical protein [Acetatifactor sp.]